MQGMSTHHIPAWVKPGTDVHAWLPPRGNGIYGPSRWYVTILSVREGGRARSDVATATVSWPGAHNNKQYIDWYPDLYEEHDAREESITMSLFYKGTLQIMELAPAPAAALPAPANPQPNHQPNAQNQNANPRSNPRSNPDRNRRRRRAQRVRPAVIAGQHECVSCHLRADSAASIGERHDRHFPWCEKYLKSLSYAGANFYVDVAKDECGYQVITTLKERLKMYGASTSGLKQDLIDRLRPLMDKPPPNLGVGSWYHFQTNQTVVALDKFCAKNHIRVVSGYVCARAFTQTRGMCM